MFFPFDPYLLLRSRCFLNLPDTYVVWRSGHPGGAVEEHGKAPAARVASVESALNTTCTTPCEGSAVCLLADDTDSAASTAGSEEDSDEDSDAESSEEESEEEDDEERRTRFGSMASSGMMSPQFGASFKAAQAFAAAHLPVGLAHKVTCDTSLYSMTVPSSAYKSACEF